MKVETIYRVFVPQLFLTFPNREVLDSSKLKDSADDNSKFDENDGKLFKSVESTVGKGEIAIFPTVFL